MKPHSLLLGHKLVQIPWKSRLIILKKSKNESIIRLPATSLLDIFNKELAPYLSDNWSSMFIDSIFIILRKWTQPKCFSTNEWVVNMVHINSKILFTYKEK